MPIMTGSLSRNTRQRAALRDAFEQAARPLSPQEALELARQTGGPMGIATVYRNIRALLDEGWLASVELPGGVLYERAGKAHHHHFQCEGCSRVFEVEGCLPAMDSLAGPQFSVRRHELVLYGLCSKCRSEATSPA
jgi:Fur family ferric uptake transcriptional regulator